jgi:hypothetical protein
MPFYELSLRSDVFDINLPVSFWVDEPLRFRIPNEGTLSEGQIAEIIEALDANEFGPERGVGETFEVLMNLLRVRVLQGIGTEDDDEEFREFGRLVGVAAHFDAGVLWLREQLLMLTGEAGRYAGGEDEATETLQAEILRRVISIEETAASEQSVFLSFRQLVQKWRTNQHTLRPYLADLREKGEIPAHYKTGRLWKIPRAWADSEVNSGNFLRWQCEREDESST